MATNPQPAIPQARIAAQALLDRLSDANPTNAADAQTVSDTITAVNEVLTRLNDEDWASRTGSMQAAAAEMKGPLKDLGDLKSQLAGVAQRIGTLANVVKDVDSLVAGCSSIFKV